MPTVRSDLDKVQQILGDTQRIGDDGALWPRDQLLQSYNDAYRLLLTKSQAVRRWTILDVPGHFSATGTSEWESRYANGGSFNKWTWATPGAECSSMFEVQLLGGVPTINANEGITQPWERSFVNPMNVPYRFALPRDNERIVALYYDNRRLFPLETRELDGLERDWRSLAGFPLAWTMGVGRERTFDIYEIVTTDNQGYSLKGGPYGISRYFSGSRTYAAADSNLYGIPRRISSPDRQYLVTSDRLGIPRTYHSSMLNLLVLEVVGPDLPDLHEEDTPTLIPLQMQKYLRYGTLAGMLMQQGEGQNVALGSLCQQRFEQGIRFLRRLSWLSRKDTDMQRIPVGGESTQRPPRVLLPSNFPRLWG